MPMFNGYSIYVAPPSGAQRGWVVRAYRDSDDFHVHSAEDCGTLGLALREVHRAIVEDLNLLRREGRAA